MYNFLNNQLKTSVSSSCPVTDGNEVVNLVSVERKGGFLAYSAIKPPVEITFKFLCPIDIQHVKLCTRVDSQQSTGFEFYAKNETTNCFTFIAKMFTNETDIVIYKRGVPLSNDSVIPKQCVYFFKNDPILSCTLELRVRIIRVANYIPCIGGMQVWAHVARSCSPTTRHTIQMLMSRSHNNLPKQQQCATTSEPSTSTSTEELHIPEEFIDPITCEVMCLPMTLPCGKTIDSTTLTKHEESNAKWGRTGTDPFTGQPFTATRKPILNIALKARIEQFLLSNAHRSETYYIQRTVGRKLTATTTTTIKQSPELNVMLLQQDGASTSLDETIQAAFQRYQIHVNSIENNDCLQQLVCCCCCCLNNNNNLYQLPCKHVICRKCLISTNDQCQLCLQPFFKSQVQKFHN